MLTDPHYQLEREIDRELKALPEIPAPATLILRVMRAIAQRQALPWFRRAWQTWPASLRVVSFATLAILFGGLCFGIWELSVLGVSAASQKYGSVFTMLNGLWVALGAVFNATLNSVQRMPKPYLIGCLAAIGLAYSMCAVFGTFCLAVARNMHRFHNEK